MKVNHGANLYELSKKYGFLEEEFKDFSSNINPIGASTLAKKEVIENIDIVSTYPDPNYTELKKTISKYCNCDEENMILGSGATELISLFIKSIKPKNSLILCPVYSEYENNLKKVESNISKFYAEVKDNFELDIKNLIDETQLYSYDLIVICNPNNPTGFTLKKSEIEKLLKSTDAKVMIDETYIEFTDTDIYSSCHLINHYSNLFIIRGTSKFFSTPGIRLGYGLISDKILRQKMLDKLDLWNINVLAAKMGEIMFRDFKYISDTSKFIKKERLFLISELKKIEKLKVYNTNGNFILIKIMNSSLNSESLRNKLLSHKMIIRDCSSFEGLDNTFFRICILNHNDNITLINCLNNIFKY